MTPERLAEIRRGIEVPYQECRFMQQAARDMLAEVDRLRAQVTTVEELDALPVGSVVTSPEAGITWEKFEFHWYATRSDVPDDVQIVADEEPLTIVWQP